MTQEEFEARLAVPGFVLIGYRYSTEAMDQYVHLTSNRIIEATSIMAIDFRASKDPVTATHERRIDIDTYYGLQVLWAFYRVMTPTELLLLG